MRRPWQGIQRLLTLKTRRGSHVDRKFLRIELLKSRHFTISKKNIPTPVQITVLFMTESTIYIFWIKKTTKPGDAFDSILEAMLANRLTIFVHLKLEA